MQTSLWHITEIRHKHQRVLVTFGRQQKSRPAASDIYRDNSFVGTRAGNPRPLVLSRRGKLQHIEKFFTLTESFYSLIRLISEK